MQSNGKIEITNAYFDCHIDFSSQQSFNTTRNATATRYVAGIRWWFCGVMNLRYCIVTIELGIWQRVCSLGYMQSTRT